MDIIHVIHLHRRLTDQMKTAHGTFDFSRSRGERGKDHEKSKKTCKWKVDAKRVVLVLLKQ